MERVTIFWTERDSFVRWSLQKRVGLPLSCTVNGEQYVEVDERQKAMLEAFAREGRLQFRNKELEVRNGRLVPADSSMYNKPVKTVR